MTRRPIQEWIRPEPLLSICCTTYNHEAYLRQALDGILMQKVSFPCEILIGEDASSDGSRAVLQEYERNHPGVFTVFYREQNLGMVDNGLDLGRRTRGRYLAWLETDDYWTHEDKLQIQVDFLEAHPDFLAVAHQVQVVNEDGTPSSWVYPACTDPEYTLKHVRRDILPSQTAAFLRRNEFRDPPFDASLILDSRTIPGDRRVYFSFAANGRIHCLPEVMSSYRFSPFLGTSFSATTRHDDLYYIEFYEEFLEYARKCRFRREALISAEFLYFFRVLCARLNRRDGITPEFVKHARSRLEHPLLCTVMGYLAFLQRRLCPRLRQLLSLATKTIRSWRP
ncbi:MAG: glycosyltransferase [Candidatus Xenobium sp.]|jgi:glycosyltransferase involved in cell wall biosynthesis|nr:glycosyltransferase [Burkholderiales bacterium]